MDVRMVREAIETGRGLRAAPQQVVAEAEAALPGGLRDEVRVFHTEASVALGDAEAAGNHLSGNGEARFLVLYAQGDLTRVRCAQANADFSRQLTLPAASAARYTPACEITAVSSRVFNGRLLLRAEMLLSADGEETGEAHVVTQVEEGDVQTLTRAVTLQRVVGFGEGQSLARGEFELSDVLQVTQTLCAQGQARVEDIVGGADGRVTVSGTIDICAHHASALPGRPLVYTQHSMPFEQVVTLSGEEGEVLSALTDVVDVAAVAQEAEGGARLLRAEADLRVTLCALREQSLLVVTDAFATAGGALAVHGGEISWRAASVNEQSAQGGRVQLLLPDNAPRIKTALAAFAHPVLIGASAQGGKLTADVLMQTTFVYMTEDSGIPVSYFAEEPLRVTFACAALPQDALSLSASHVEASAIAGDRAEARFVLSLHARGARYERLFAAADITRGEEQPDKGCLALYIAEPGDRLWDVMKRYRLSADALAAFNGELDTADIAAPLPEGTRLIAYRRQTT